jgi:protein PhnA
MSIDASLLARASNACELCQATTSLRVHAVRSARPREAAIVVCEACDAQLAPGVTLDAGRWRCLEGSIWSEVPAVKVASHRLLVRLRAQPWASAALDQVDLEPDLRAWADEPEAEGEGDEQVVVKDSNGAVLADGDSVTLIKDLDVKGAGFTAKRGTLVKSIKLTSDPRLVDARVNGVLIVLKTEFLKKA